MRRRTRATLRAIAADLDAGRTTARRLAETSLAAIADPAGEGARAFLHLNPQKLLATADAQDALRKQGRAPSPFSGIPFAVKDLFDVAGEVTTAGSKLLANAPPAARDCDVVANMRTAGFVPLGRTNMTEFAYSGLGLNPHYGTPLSIYGRDERRIPGGSSSGTAVAIADGMCAVGLGSDTGGSCRIPAAFNGIVGYKPSANRVSKRGVYPLSASLDSIGPLANSVECCAIIDGILSGQPAPKPQRDNRKLRLGVLQGSALDGLDEAVSRDFARVISSLSAAGHQLEDLHVPLLAELPGLLTNGGLVAVEAWAHHASMIGASEEAYDPRVSSRMRFGANISPADASHIKARRNQMIAEFADAARHLDAVICPTVAVIPPRIADLAEEADYRRTNGLCLRNTYIFNFLDGCSISIPMQAEGEPVTGLMLSLPNGGDMALFDASYVVETIV